MSRNVVIVDGYRTAFGRIGGSLRQFYPTELSGFVIKGLCEKTGILEKAKVDCVYAGSALHDAHCNNFARIASLYGGLPYETRAHYVEMQCGSAIMAAAWLMLLIPELMVIRFTMPSREMVSAVSRLITLAAFCKSKSPSFTMLSSSI